MVTTSFSYLTGDYMISYAPVTGTGLPEMQWHQPEIVYISLLISKTRHDLLASNIYQKPVIMS